MRAFHHGAILYNTTSDIRTPKDLEGRKVGVNRGYTVTTGLWARSILQHEYGVDSEEGHLGAVRRRARRRIPAAVQRRADRGGHDARGDAALGGDRRRQRRADDSPDIKPLIPNAKEAGLIGLRQGGLYPINHTVVVKDEVLAAHPEIAADLFDAFVRAKKIYVDRLKSGQIAEPTPADKTFASVMEITGDPASLRHRAEPPRDRSRHPVQRRAGHPAEAVRG